MVRLRQHNQADLSFCNTAYPHPLPVLTFYDHRGSKYIPANHRLMVYKDLYLYKWHVDRTVSPSERLTEDQSSPWAISFSQREMGLDQPEFTYLAGCRN